MRKLIYAINTSLDGCVDHTTQAVDDEKLGFFTELVRGVDVQVFGRRTYELMVPYWPDVLKRPGETKADTEYARAFISTKNVVFSRSLESVEDGKTRVVRGDLENEIRKLKEEPGRDILVGGVDLASQLIALGVVDEFLFVVGPVVVGAGRRLLDSVSLPEKPRLKLVDSKILQSGSVALRYLKQ